MGSDVRLEEEFHFVTCRGYNFVTHQADLSRTPSHGGRGQTWTLTNVVRCAVSPVYFYGGLCPVVTQWAKGRVMMQSGQACWCLFFVSTTALSSNYHILSKELFNACVVLSKLASALWPLCLPSFTIRLYGCSPSDVTYLFLKQSYEAYCLKMPHWKLWPKHYFCQARLRQRGRVEPLHQQLQFAHLAVA